MDWTQLTQAELRVAEFLSRGLAQKEIASQLENKESTIRTHATRIYDKLGCKREHLISNQDELRQFAHARRFTKEILRCCAAPADINNLDCLQGHASVIQLGSTTVESIGTSRGGSEIVRSGAARWATDLTQNDPCGVVMPTQKSVSRRKRIFYKEMPFAEVCARRELRERITILSGNALVVCEELESLVLHERSGFNFDHSRTLHSFGGAFIPPRYGRTTCDINGLKDTAVRETWEEAHLQLDHINQAPIAVIEESVIGFLQIVHVGVPTAKKAVLDAIKCVQRRPNSEGRPVLIRFDELPCQLSMQERWAPSGWVHIMLWLSLGCPGTSFARFDQASSTELYQECLGIASRWSRWPISNPSK